MELKENERLDDLGINNLKILQNKNYFCFGFDSVMLANNVKSNSSNNVILDLCSGSGVISVIISAKVKSKKIIAVELQGAMFDLLKTNIHINNLENKIVALNENITNVNSIRKKIIDETGNGVVDVIVCNPPYKESGTGCVNPDDIKYIARHEVFCKLEDVFCTSSKLLNNKGELYLVHKPERLTDLLVIARKYNLEPKELTFIQPTDDKKPSIVLLKYVKNGGNEINVRKTIIEYDKNGDYTDEICKIYGIDKK